MKDEDIRIAIDIIGEGLDGLCAFDGTQERQRALALSALGLAGLVEEGLA